MNQLMIWYRLHLKRWLKKPFLILWCVVFPLLMVFIHQLLPQDMAWTQIYVVDEDQTDTSRQVMASLVDDEESFDFVEAESFDEALLKVQRQETPLFIVLEQGLGNFVADGEQGQPIAIYSGTELKIDKMVTEIVFAHWFDVTAGEILIDYMETLPELEVDIQRLSALDEAYYQGDKIFSLSFEWADGEVIEQSGFFPSPMEVLLSLTIFVSMFFIQLLVGNDRRKGIYGAFPLDSHHKFGTVASLAYATPLLISSILAYGLTIGDFGLNFGYWLLYNATVWLFTYAVSALLPTKNAVVSTIPLWVTGSIATAPGFWDWSTVEGLWNKLPYLFPPSYVQWAWRGDEVRALVMMGVLVLIGIMGIKLSSQSTPK